MGESAGVSDLCHNTHSTYKGEGRGGHLPKLGLERIWVAGKQVTKSSIEEAEDLFAATGLSGGDLAAVYGGRCELRVRRCFGCFLRMWVDPVEDRG